jgi:hypothetical protein
MAEGDEQWMQMNDTNWRGLGLTDPIKKVEASAVFSPT